MRTITLLHPFSAKAIGLHEKDLFYSHSKPHEKALLKLQEEGYRVSIDYFTGRYFPFSKTINGIKKCFFPITKPLFSKKHRWRKQYSFFHLWKTYFNPPDITIINMSGHGSPYSFQLAKLLLKNKKPYVAMLGGIHVSDDLQAKEYYHNAHHLIVHTELQKRQLMQNDVFKGLNIQVMPLGIDTTIFKPYENNSDNIELLFVGRISRLKQIELCIETLAILKSKLSKEVTLTIIGPVSDPGYSEELIGLVAKLQVEESVQFVGPVQQNDLVSFYQKAHLLLTPSKHESFGMVMVEAMACGTPVAAIKGSGGPDEIVEDGVNGILATRETFPNKVLEFSQSEEMQLKFSSSARRSVEEKWSLDVTIHALRNSIRLVLEK